MKTPIEILQVFLNVNTCLNDSLIIENPVALKGTLIVRLKKLTSLSFNFKHERSAEALPPPYYIQPGQPNRYGIRLYCIRLGRGAVVLLNGDLKTHNDPEQCPKCKKHFQFANALARKLDDAIREKEFFLLGREVHLVDNFEIEL